MPTIREYFFAEARTLTSHADYGIAVDGETVSVTARAHYDFDAGVQYASYLVPASERTIPALKLLLSDPGFANRMAAGAASVTMSHATLREPQRSAADLPFTGRIYLYTEARLTGGELADLQRVAAERNVMLDIRDGVYAEERTRLEVPRGFISHDTRDKVEVARPLAEKLRQMLCPIWYDEFSLAVGDSLRASIDKGLHEAPKCVLIISPNFISNTGWAAGEFNAVVGKHFGAGGGVLLPIWHNVTRDEVAAYSPLVADLIALDSSLGIDELANRLYNPLMATRQQ